MDDLLSDWLDESPYGMTKLTLRWSANAIREAFDATHADQVGDRGATRGWVSTSSECRLVGWKLV